MAPVPSTSWPEQEQASFATDLAAGRPARLLTRERAEEQEARFDVDAMEAGLGHAEVRIERGDPGVVICEVAEEGGFDLIVVGSHGHGLLKRMLIGSVSTHVLHRAPCPVLVVREQDSAEL